MQMNVVIIYLNTSGQMGMGVAYIVAMLKKPIQMENYLYLSFNRSKLLGQIALVPPPEWLNVARKVFNILTRR